MEPEIFAALCAVELRVGQNDMDLVELIQVRAADLTFQESELLITWNGPVMQDIG